MKKILAIDDQKDNLTIYEAVIQNRMSGHKVLTAMSGNEGIKIAKEQQPDAILLDFIMPGMDGYEATREIRKFNKDLVIIVQTVYALSGDREKALEAGCDDYITKPINKEKLMEIIGKHFKK